MTANKIIGMAVVGLLGYVGWKGYKAGFTYGDALGKAVSREALAAASATPKPNQSGQPTPVDTGEV